MNKLLQSTSSEKLNIKLLDRQKDTKIKFLQEQNSNLRAQINDLEETLKLNKESLSQMLKKESYGGLTSQDSTLKANNNKMPIYLEETNETNNLVRTLNKIIEKLTKENQNHFENIRNLIKERNHAQTRAFINELISDESQKNENEMISDLRDRILFLQAVVNQKKMNDEFKVEKKTEDVIICKSIIQNPDEQMMKTYKDLQSLKQVLKVIYRKYNRLKTEQQDLNLFLELNKLKEKKILPLGKENEPSQSKETDHFYDNASVITYYKEFMKETGDQSNDEFELSPLNSPLPQKIMLNRSSQFSNSKQSNIPKLDLTKAKKIQETNARRNIPQKNPNFLNKSVESGVVIADQIEKIKRLENELLRVKRLLQFEIVNHNRMAEECEKALRDKEEFAEKVETLKSSQKEYERKWEKIFNYLTFYRESYFKSIFQLYKDKISQEKLENLENDLNQLIGLDTVQNRLNEEKKPKPIYLKEISFKEIENQFSQRISQKNEKKDNDKKEKNYNKNDNKNENNGNIVKNQSFSHRKKSISDEYLLNETPHINNLPDMPYNKEMKFVNSQKKVKVKRKISKSQIFDYNSALKKIGKEKKSKKKISLSQTSQEPDYGKKMSTMMEKRLISPLSKSINEENDFYFLSKNNLEFKRKNTGHIMLNEELFL